MVSVKTMNTKWMSNKKDIKAKFYSLGVLVKICSLYHRFIYTSCRYTSWLCALWAVWDQQENLNAAAESY